jgi:hypothetical protein
MRGIGLKSAGLSNPNGGREIDISDRASSLSVLRDFLAADNHDAELIKSCSPFVGFSKIAAYP